jgi:hypothetical protein
MIGSPSRAPAKGDDGRTGEPAMLWTILAILFVLWLLGVVASIGGAFIHLLLVLAIVVFIAQLVTRRSSGV